MALSQAVRNPSRFPKGLNNVPSSHPLARYGRLDPASWATDFNDFFTYLASDWTIANTGTSVVGLAAGLGGVLSVATGATSGNNSSFTRVTAAFTLANRFRTYFRASVSLSDVSATTFLAGLVNLAPTIFAPTDGVYFAKANGSAVLTANYVVGSSVTTLALTSVASATLVNSTMVDLAIEFDGNTNLIFYINQIAVGTITIPSLTAVALTPSFQVQTNAAAAKTLLLDYIFAAQGRTLIGKF